MNLIDITKVMLINPEYIEIYRTGGKLFYKTSTAIVISILTLDYIANNYYTPIIFNTNRRLLDISISLYKD